MIHGVLRIDELTAIIYTIAYGDDANKNLLSALANRTNGKMFTSDPTNIKNVYFLISSEF